MDKLIQKIKGKKNLGISDKYVIKILEKNLEKEEFKELFAQDYKKIIRNKKFKELVKEIRKELYSVYGVFQVKRQWKKEELLDGLKKAKNLDDIKKISREILKLHSSSRERLNNYELIYETIFRITGSFRKIIDLGCGLNGASLTILGKALTEKKEKASPKDSNLEYVGYEISESDVNFMNKYFKIVEKYGIKGKIYLNDIMDDLNFKKGDICFLFKFLDFVKNKKEYFNEFIKSIKCKYLIVSFSKKTISMKKMKETERKWFIRLIEELQLGYKRFDTEDEIFYVIRLKTKKYHDITVT